jgi:hypothetical protein
VNLCNRLFDLRQPVGVVHECAHQFLMDRFQCLSFYPEKLDDKSFFLSPSIVTNGFRKISQLIRACLTRWFSFGKSVIIAYLPNLCFMLLEIGMPVRSRAHRDGRDQGLSGYHVLFILLVGRLICCSALIGIHAATLRKKIKYKRLRLPIPCHRS